MSDNMANVDNYIKNLQCKVYGGVYDTYFEKATVLFQNGEATSQQKEDFCQRLLVSMARFSCTLPVTEGDSKVRLCTLINSAESLCDIVFALRDCTINCCCK